MYECVKEMERSHEQYKYNLSGLFGVMLKKKNFERNHAFFCSQFVARVLQLGGIKLCDKSANLVMPKIYFMRKNWNLFIAVLWMIILFFFSQRPLLRQLNSIEEALIIKDFK